MSNYEATPRERLIDSKTMLPLVGGDVPQSNSRYRIQTYSIAFS